jgi:hypothetical protein
MKKLALLISLCLLASCGGSGSSGGDSGNFSGDYLFSFTLQADGCQTNLPATINALWRIQQSGSDIIAENLSSGVTVPGSTVGNGWIASISEQIIIPTTAQVCTETSQIQYNGAGLGSLSISRICNATSQAPAGQCETVYVGDANRA